MTCFISWSESQILRQNRCFSRDIRNPYPGSYKSINPENMRFLGFFRVFSKNREKSVSGTILTPLIRVQAIFSMRFFESFLVFGTPKKGQTPLRHIPYVPKVVLVHHFSFVLGGTNSFLRSKFEKKWVGGENPFFGFFGFFRVFRDFRENHEKSTKNGVFGIFAKIRKWPKIDDFSGFFRIFWPKIGSGYVIIWMIIWWDPWYHDIMIQPYDHMMVSW